MLPEAFAQDAQRLTRFEREAKTLAALNHPNIAIIHGLERGDGIRAPVMELVEGPTLADRIVRGRIAIDEALPIATQIAEALEAAHEQGIGDLVQFGEPKSQFKLSFPAANPGSIQDNPYDVGSDGRILGFTTIRDSGAEGLVVLSNWDAELTTP